MRGVIKATQILPMFWLGLIIVGAVGRTTAMWVSGLVLLIIDVAVGLILQYILDHRYLIKKQYSKNDWSDLSFEEKRAAAHDSIEKSKQQMRDSGVDIDGIIEKFCDDFNKEHKLGKYSDISKDKGAGVDEALCCKMDEIFDKLKVEKSTRVVRALADDEAGRLLIDVCNTIPHSPSMSMLRGVCLIALNSSLEEQAIDYHFGAGVASNVIGSIVMIELVHTQDSNIRLFAVEKSFPYALCEYVGNSHRNYGQLDSLNEVSNRIRAILNK